MKKSSLPKILVILGPTATGKSNLAVKLAKKYNGEVISADSRQVYKGLDIATGKITKKEMGGISHHMISIIDPKKKFSVSEYKIQAEKEIEKILEKGKLPIICGGTGFYIQSIVDDLALPEVPPNNALRKKLEKKSTKELFLMLKKLDVDRAKNIDKNNPVRLIRAVEIAKAIGKVPNLEKREKYKTLQIGLKIPPEELKEKIHRRTADRMRKGMINEAKKLYKNGLSLKRMRELGLEYKHLANYLENQIDKENLFKEIEKGNLDYAKRQMTWFKKDKRIIWFHPKNIKDINKEIDIFLTKDRIL
jgi:tRNA dimethylallyltransferase